MDERFPDPGFAFKLAALVFALMLVGAFLTSSLMEPTPEYPAAEDVPEFEPAAADAGWIEPIDLGRLPREGDEAKGD